MGYYNCSPQETEMQRFNRAVEQKMDDYKTSLLTKLSAIIPKSYTARFASIMADSLLQGNGEVYEVMQDLEIEEDHLYAWADEKTKFEKSYYGLEY